MYSPARHEPAPRVIKQTQGDATIFGDSGDLCAGKCSSTAFCLSPVCNNIIVAVTMKDWDTGVVETEYVLNDSPAEQGTRYDQRLSLSHQRPRTEYSFVTG